MIEFQDLVQTFQMALKARLMYTGSHPRARSGLQTLADQLGEWLTAKPTLHIAASLCELVAAEPRHRDRSVLQQVVDSRRAP
jgi:hypothetical protein